MAQQKEIVEKFKKHYPFVDIVFGVNGIDTLPDILCEKLATRKRVLRMPAERGEIIEDMPIRRDSTFRAWLPIMYGCDISVLTVSCRMCADESAAVPARIFCGSSGSLWPRATRTSLCWARM